MINIDTITKHCAMTVIPEFDRFPEGSFMNIKETNVGSHELLGPVTRSKSNNTDWFKIDTKFEEQHKFFVVYVNAGTSIDLKVQQTGYDELKVTCKYQNLKDDTFEVRYNSTPTKDTLAYVILNTRVPKLYICTTLIDTKCDNIGTINCTDYSEIQVAAF